MIAVQDIRDTLAGYYASSHKVAAEDGYECLGPEYRTNPDQRFFWIVGVEGDGRLLLLDNRGAFLRGQNPDHYRAVDLARYHDALKAHREREKENPRPERIPGETYAARTADEARAEDGPARKWEVFDMTTAARIQDWFDTDPNEHVPTGTFMDS